MRLRDMLSLLPKDSAFEFAFNADTNMWVGTLMAGNCVFTEEVFYASKLPRLLARLCEKYVRNRLPG